MCDFINKQSITEIRGLEIPDYIKKEPIMVYWTEIYYIFSIFSFCEEQKLIQELWIYYSHMLSYFLSTWANSYFFNHCFWMLKISKNTEYFAEVWKNDIVNDDFKISQEVILCDFIISLRNDNVLSQTLRKYNYLSIQGINISWKDQAPITKNSQW